MSDRTRRAFASYGGEKMIYDVRMGPQAVLHKGMLYVVYQANPSGAEAHPHIVTYDLATKLWSDPRQVGQVPHYDHHFCPVLWFDDRDRLHILYKCHSRDGGTHLISAEPLSVARWTPGPTIAKSVSYPHILPMADGKLVLFYRTLGHMGYWSYQVSVDGGNTWETPHTLVDMDRDPQTNHDTWSGSYHSAIATPDGRSLHIGFVYLDEQRRRNPLYNRRFESKRTINRYHLYYLRLEIESGVLYTIDGEGLQMPVNRAQAERCKVWDTGYRLTNMPAILSDRREQPCFLLPVTGKSPWECTFYYVYRQGQTWQKAPVAETNNTWNGCLLSRSADSVLTAHVIVGRDYGELHHYGGGDLEEWVSADDGATWLRKAVIAPDPGLLYNNPRAVEYATGGMVDDVLLFFGWEGPGSIDPDRRPGAQPRNRGRAYLWRNSECL